MKRLLQILALAIVLSSPATTGAQGHLQRAIGDSFKKIIVTGEQVKFIIEFLKDPNSLDL